MKYLKTYEGIIDLKKYIIVDFLGTYAILENIKIFGKKEPKIKIDIKYILHSNGSLSINKEYDPYIKPLYVLQNRALYTSDDFESCKKILPLIGNSNRYNL